MRVLNAHFISSDPVDLGTKLAVPFQSVPVVISSGTLSASFSTPGLNILHEYGYSVTIAISGSLTGSVELQASNDPGNDRLPPAFNQQTSGQSATTLNQGIVNWTQVASSLQQLSASTLGGSSNVLYNAEQQFYKWLRVVWTHNAGTGSIDAYITAKGDAD